MDILIHLHNAGYPSEYALSVEKQTKVQVILFTLQNMKPVLCVFKNLDQVLQPYEY